MTKKVETVIESRPVTQVVGFTCNICTAEYEGHDAFDGFTFQYRPGEEDELIIEARDICRNCYLEEPSSAPQELLHQILELIAEYAPGADILGPAWDYPRAEED